MVAVIKLKEPQEILHYALGVEWVVGSAEGKHREVRRGMTQSRRDNHRLNSGVQLVVGEFDEFVCYSCADLLLAASLFFSHWLDLLCLAGRPISPVAGDWPARQTTDIFRYTVPR